jgi:hypothetical protein
MARKLMVVLKVLDMNEQVVTKNGAGGGDCSKALWLTWGRNVGGSVNGSNVNSKCCKDFRQTPERERVQEQGVRVLVVMLMLMDGDCSAVDVQRVAKKGADKVEVGLSRHM